MKITFDHAKKKGFVFQQARHWIEYDKTGKYPINIKKLARDAALITSSNTTVPPELVAYIDPKAIEILTAVRNATEIYSESKKGSFSTPYYKYQLEEYTGYVAPYSDYSTAGRSDHNAQWKVQDSFRFQTGVEYGDLEMEMSSEAKINLAAKKQRAAASIIAQAHNKFYLLGVAGKKIYGILNNPELPAMLTAKSITKNGTSSTSWEDKTSSECYEDVVDLYGAAAENGGGHITEDSEMTLAMSPKLRAVLSKKTDFNISATQMIQDNFKNLKFATLPELSNKDSGETMFLFVHFIQESDTAELCFGDKFRAGRVIAKESSFSQKFSASTFGGAVTQPYGIVSMNGM